MKLVLWDQQQVSTNRPPFFQIQWWRIHSFLFLDVLVYSCEGGPQPLLKLSSCYHDTIHCAEDPRAEWREAGALGSEGRTERKHHWGDLTPGTNSPYFSSYLDIIFLKERKRHASLWELISYLTFRAYCAKRVSPPCLGLLDEAISWLPLPFPV